MSEKDFKDPKDLFLFRLAKNMEEIYDILSSGKIATGAKYMSIFLQRISIPDTEQFKDMKMLQEKWKPTYWHLNPLDNSELSIEDTWDIWTALSELMNNTYFLGWNGSKPQEKTPSKKLGGN